MENNKKTQMLDIFSANKIMIVILITMTIVLSLSFCNNILKVADKTTFKDWQNDSEAFVVGRMIKSRQDGLKSDYGLLQRDPNWLENNKFITDDHVDAFFLYTSQIGLQGLVFGIIDKFTPLNSYKTLKSFYLINSLLLAILIALVAFWASKQFNLLSGLFIMIGCTFSPWLVFSAKNLYWVLWTILLPFTIILYLQWLEHRSTKINQWVFMLASFITIFIRTACGFEFISSILISVEIPVIFYAIVEKWNRKKYICRSIFIGVGGLLALIATFCINMWQRIMYFGDFKIALGDIKYNISKRTGIFNVEVAPDCQNSLEQPILKVIDTYLREGSPLVFGYRMFGLILFLIILTLGLIILQKYIPSIKEKRNKLVSLTIVTYVSLLAPISWMILAKGHSVIHTHINYILWYFPSILLILALCGAIVPLICKDIWNKQYHNVRKKLFIVVVCVILILIWPIYRYNHVQDWIKNTQQVEQAQNDGVSIYKNKFFELIYYDNALFYKASKRADVSRRFFLHIIPVNPDDLFQGNIEHGFDNRDFEFATSMIRLPFWKTYYIARVDLPNYEIKKINSGQFSGPTRFWEISVALSEGD